ncbi:UNVERIFIED_CONTAM: hypothetical protein FKN15_047552 [Acipenser sinensis]
MLLAKEPALLYSGIGAKLQCERTRVRPALRLCVDCLDLCDAPACGNQDRHNIYATVYTLPYTPPPSLSPPPDPLSHQSLQHITLTDRLATAGAAPSPGG